MIQPIDIMKEAKKHNLEVDFVRYGIASRVGNTIIMNHNLLRYDKFCKDVLDHEIRHTSEINKHNLMMDLFEGSIYDNFKFCLRHPLGLIQFIPFGIYRGTFLIDVNQLIFYFIVLIMFGVWWKLLI